ncbi:MAG TPA: hypothetical protein VJ767_04300 [Nitrososphaeraceae archaeon]|nr:hypothetical protein [Nitrososphaeraceae archaeon]
MILNNKNKRLILLPIYLTILISSIYLSNSILRVSAINDDKGNGNINTNNNLVTNIINKFEENDNQSEQTTKMNVSENIIDENKNIEIKKIINDIFNSLFLKTEQKYINDEIGIEITFPKGWGGVEFQFPFPMAIVSPSGLNLTNLFSPMINNLLENYSNKNWEDLSPQEQNAIIEEGMGKIIESFSNLNSTMSIGIYNKEFIQLINSMPQNTVMPTDSLTSIYEYLYPQDSPILNCNRTTLDHVTLNSNLQAEVSTGICSYHQYSDIHSKYSNYLMLSPNAIISIQYSSNLNEKNNFLSQFENAMKSLSVKNALPINEQTLQQFLIN